MTNYWALMYVNLKKTLLAVLIFTMCVSCINAQKASDEKEAPYPVTKTEVQWKSELSAQAFYVLRQAGTERPFTGKYDKHYESGTFVCAGCNAPLYESKHKYDSGTGWPSFDRGIEENLEYDTDHKLGYPRTEIRCSQCGGHLGHRFSDGPTETTGIRHCINSVALNFVANISDEQFSN